jgi:cell division protein FtsL
MSDKILMISLLAATVFFSIKLIKQNKDIKSLNIEIENLKKELEIKQDQVIKYLPLAIEHNANCK